VIATGISSVGAQLVIIREFLTQFNGNEFVIALILFNWLLLGSAGTFMARGAAGRVVPASPQGLAFLSLALALMPSVLILIIRLLRQLLFIPGVSVGFGATFAFTFLCMLPYCLLVGFALPYALFVLRDKIPDYAGARIYIVDNIGDIAGGLIFTVLLAFLATPLTIMLLVNIPLLAALINLAAAGGMRKSAVYAGAAVVCAVLGAGLGMERASLHNAPGKLIEYRETRYGRIKVYRQQEQVTVFADGLPVSSTQRPGLAEELIHYPLAQIDKTDRILLISAVSGVMAQLVKHRPRRVDYVELNPAITAIEMRYGLIQKIPGLQAIHRDARTFLVGSRERYDAIIVCLPEPGTYQFNRFFTAHFFKLAADHLTPGGILSFSMKGYDNYLSETQRHKLSIMDSTARSVFSDVLLLPGQNIVFLCRNGRLKQDIPALLKDKRIATDYIGPYFYGNLTTERITALNALMDRQAPRNHDLRPRLMQLMFSQWFEKFATSPTWFYIPFVLLLGLYLAFAGREEFVLFTTGWFNMGCEILVIFAFQIIFGYIYFQIGLIVTVFLAGLLPGAWLAMRGKANGRHLLMASDGLLVTLCAVLAASLVYARDLLPVWYFLVFGFTVSLVCGFQFPVALALRRDSRRALTGVLTADLAGAACGTLITSAVLVPYAGILWSTAALAALKVVSLSVSAWRH